MSESFQRVVPGESFTGFGKLGSDRSQPQIADLPTANLSASSAAEAYSLFDCADAELNVECIMSTNLSRVRC